MKKETLKTLRNTAVLAILAAFLTITSVQPSYADDPPRRNFWDVIRTIVNVAETVHYICTVEPSEPDPEPDPDDDDQDDFPEGCTDMPFPSDIAR